MSGVENISVVLLLLGDAVIHDAVAPGSGHTTHAVVSSRAYSSGISMMPMYLFAVDWYRAGSLCNLLRKSILRLCRFWKDGRGSMLWRIPML